MTGNPNDNTYERILSRRHHTEAYDRRLWLIVVAVSIAVALALAGCASPDTRREAQEQLGAADRTLRDSENDPNLRWFRANLKDARAVLIVPRMTGAAFVFGGSGGEAVALPRDPQDGGWIGPAFYKIGAGNVGLQVGADESQVVILAMNQRALDHLLSSSFKLGGNATITAGPVGGGAAATVRSDFVSFTPSKGAYAGFSLKVH